ncbi:MAG: DUF3987 domain-containing protein [Chloroflexota bacterium]|nr:DUF3987 domain-containing protein [Chloroflexota bacterium]
MGNPFIRWPVRKPDGTTAFYRERYELQKTDDKDRNRFRQPPGVKVMPYGLEWVKDLPPDQPLLFVEGETDVWTLDMYGIIAIGLPGTNAFPEEWLPYFEGRESVLWNEGDEAAKGLETRIAKRIPNVRVIDAPDGIKDPNEAHLKGMLSREWLDDLIAQARPGGISGRPHRGYGPTDRDTSFGTGFSRNRVYSESRRNPDNLPDVPEFPTSALPKTARDYVQRYADVLDVPAGMIATPLLVAAGATLGNRAILQVKKGFEQRPGLFAAVVAPPGKTKSPAQDAALAPVWALQRAAKQAYDEAYAAWEKDAAQAKKAKLPIPAEPTLESFVTTDATLEAIVAMLGTGPGLLMARDEVSGFVGSFNQYRGGKGADREAWLSAWAGGSVKVDRKGGPPIIVENPVIGVVGGIQPDMLPR